VGQWLVLGWFGGWGTSDSQLARLKLGKKTHPIQGSQHHPTAAMVPSSWYRHIKQLANMLRDKSMLLKLKNNIVFTIVFISYFKARCIVDVPCLCVWGMHQQAALRVSYSQRAALRV
jgi:hypothetical protein